METTINAKILIIDDSEVFLGLAREALKNRGYKNVIFAQNGNQGLKLLLEEKPDLAVIDIVLPDISGFEICKQGRRELKETVKLILLTGEINMVDAAKAVRSGADMFTVKTFNNSLLIDSIDKVFNRD